jgi:hypothetical protein
VSGLRRPRNFTGVRACRLAGLSPPVRLCRGAQR